MTHPLFRTPLASFLLETTKDALSQESPRFFASKARWTPLLKDSMTLAKLIGLLLFATLMGLIQPLHSVVGHMKRSIYHFLDPG